MPIDRWPALLGLLSGVWSARQVWLSFRASGSFGSVLLLTLALAWLLVAVSLLRHERVAKAGWLIVVLCLLETIVRGADEISYGLALLAWMGLLTALTEGQRDERALLLRVCASVVYGFGAVTKLNPAWLAGDQLWRLASTRGQSVFIADLLDTPFGPVLAISVILLEGWLAIGLWWRRTRRATAALGVLLHGGLVLTATSGPAGLANLLILNGGLVALYVAFWTPIRRVPAGECVRVSDRDD